MRKERLLDKKREVLSRDAKFVLTEEDIKMFSVNQLRLLCDILERSSTRKEDYNPFYTLSACEVLQKSTGKIAYFENSGEIHEETEEEVLSGAACNIYRNYMKKKRS